MNFENNKLQFYVDIVRYLDSKYKDSLIRVEGESIVFDNVIITLHSSENNKLIIRLECFKTGVIVEDEVLWFNLNSDLSVFITDLLIKLRDKQLELSNTVKSSIIEMLNSMYTQDTNDDPSIQTKWYHDSFCSISLHNTDVEQIKLSLSIVDKGYNEILIEKTYPLKGLTPDIIALSVIKSFQDDISILSV